MLTLKIKDIFSNRAEQTYGLMYKDEYEKDCCALFSFKEPKVLNFHTANCKFPILVVYLRDDYHGLSNLCSGSDRIYVVLLFSVCILDFVLSYSTN